MSSQRITADLPRPTVDEATSDETERRLSGLLRNLRARLDASASFRARHEPLARLMSADALSHPPIRALMDEAAPAIAAGTDSWRILVQAVASKATALGLPSGCWAEIARRTFVSSARRGEVIVPASATPNFFSVVAAGAVAIVVHDDRDRRSIVQIAKPGFIFSLAPFMSRSEQRRFAAIAYEDAVVASVDREVVRDVLRRLGPDSHMGLLMYMCRALSRIIYDHCRFFRTEVPDRVLQQLVELARRFGSDGEPGVVNLRLSQTDIADLVGATRATVSHALTMLEKQGLVLRARGRYRVAPAVLARRSVRMSFGPGSTGDAVRGDPGARDTLYAVLRAAWKRLGSPAKAIDIFRECATLHRHASGDVMGMGPQPAVTLLVEGTARVECMIPGGDPVGVRIATPGQFIGVGWSVDAPDRQRPFRARALTDVMVARLELADMQRVVAALDDEQFLLLLGMYSNLLSRQIYDRCVMLPMTVDRRVDYVLRSLADEFPRADGSGTIIDLPQREDDIAVLVGAQREAVCRRAIAPAKRSGSISVVDGRFRLAGYRPAAKPDADR